MLSSPATIITSRKIFSKFCDEYYLPQTNKSYKYLSLRLCFSSPITSPSLYLKKKQSSRKTKNMVKDLIGYRFSPTGEELINDYLKNKNLGKTWLVHEAIGEINILSYIPELLPDLAVIRSKDPEWYFFSPIVYTNSKKKEMKRITGSGYWKTTGKNRIIRDKSGVEIGLKKTLMYYEGKVPNGVWTPWVMHEYHITSLPHLQINYVICQVKYKGEAKDISYGNNLTESSHSLDFDSNTAIAMYTPEPADSYVICNVCGRGGKEVVNISNGDSSSEPSLPSLVSDSNTIRLTCIIPPVFQVEQPGQGNLYENDLMLPMNEQMGGSDPNSINNSPYVQLQAPFSLQENDELLSGLPQNLTHTSYGNNMTEPSHSLVFDSNTAMASNRAPEPAIQVEQAGGNNFVGMSLDDLIDPNEDLSEWDEYYDPDTFFSDDINNTNTSLQPQAPHLSPSDNEFIDGLMNVCQRQVKDLFTLSMTENRNNHAATKPLSGTIPDYSSDSDSDAESISATSYPSTSSPVDSDGSSNRCLSSCSSTDSCKDPSTGRETRAVLSKQEVKQGTPKAIDVPIMKTEKKGWFITEEAMERNHKMKIIGFILLLALIGMITSALLNVKA
ncbi:hypothetical protein CARUB_v10000489mg [Capsella rubella]|uniref:NAC domain-containing protein n=2 Tax=Capsella rubella TaxID=81985 RepID=R0H9B7_9BRAS|nr:hypothetical protein CARUB_v10000489mg [Capsella rubella]